MVIERIKPLLTRALSNLVTLSGLMPSSGVTALWSQKSYVMSFSHKVSLILIISHYSLHFFLFLVHSRPWSWVPILGCTINKGNEVIESYKFDPQLSYVFNRKVITFSSRTQNFFVMTRLAPVIAVPPLCPLCQTWTPDIQVNPEAWLESLKELLFDLTVSLLSAETLPVSSGDSWRT